MKKVLRIDNNSMFIEDVILHNEMTPADCIEIPCPEGFFKPKWDGSQWSEGLTQEEINVIKNSTPPAPTILELQQKVNELQTQIQVLTSS